ncbi:MAG: hypothetical protein AB7N76_35410 [Planctomycetota bacterium]
MILRLTLATGAPAVTLPELAVLGLVLLVLLALGLTVYRIHFPPARPGRERGGAAARLWKALQLVLLLGFLVALALSLYRYRDLEVPGRIVVEDDSVLSVQPPRGGARVTGFDSDRREYQPGDRLLSFEWVELDDPIREALSSLNTARKSLERVRTELPQGLASVEAAERASRERLRELDRRAADLAAGLRAARSRYAKARASVAALEPGLATSKQVLGKARADLERGETLHLQRLIDDRALGTLQLAAAQARAGQAQAGSELAAAREDLTASREESAALQQRVCALTSERAEHEAELEAAARDRRTCEEAQQKRIEEGEARVAEAEARLQTLQRRRREEVVAERRWSVAYANKAYSEPVDRGTTLLFLYDPQGFYVEAEVPESLEPLVTDRSEALVYVNDRLFLGEVRLGQRAPRERPLRPGTWGCAVRLEHPTPDLVQLQERPDGRLDLKCVLRCRPELGQQEYVAAALLAALVLSFLIGKLLPGGGGRPPSGPLASGTLGQAPPAAPYGPSSPPRHDPGQRRPRGPGPAQPPVAPPPLGGWSPALCAAPELLEPIRPGRAEDEPIGSGPVRVAPGGEEPAWLAAVDALPDALRPELQLLIEVLQRAQHAQLEALLATLEARGDEG